MPINRKNRRGSNPDITLKEYIDQRLSSIERYATQLEKNVDQRFNLLGSNEDQRFKSIETAAALVNANTDVRFGQTNEWRTTYGDQQKDFPTRPEVNSRMDAMNTARDILTNRVGKLETGAANLQGRMWAIGIGFAIFTTAVTTIVSVFLHFLGK